MVMNHFLGSSENRASAVFYAVSSSLCIGVDASPSMFFVATEESVGEAVDVLA